MEKRNTVHQYKISYYRPFHTPFTCIDVLKRLDFDLDTYSSPHVVSSKTLPFTTGKRRFTEGPYGTRVRGVEWEKRGLSKHPLLLFRSKDRLRGYCFYLFVVFSYGNINPKCTVPTEGFHFLLDFFVPLVHKKYDPNCVFTYQYFILTWFFTLDDYYLTSFRTKKVKKRSFYFYEERRPRSLPWRGYSQRVRNEVSSIPSLPSSTLLEGWRR